MKVIFEIIGMLAIIFIGGCIGAIINKLNKY